MTLLDIKRALRSGKYAWPGGYPLFFVTADGAALSFEAVRAEWRNVVSAHLDPRYGVKSGWYVDGIDTNWEDPELFCDHTGKRIESAYAEDQAISAQNGS